MPRGKELATQDAEALELQATIDALEALGIQVAEVLDSEEEIGDGWRVIPSKDLLVNVPFVITDYKFAEGDYPQRDENGNPIPGTKAQFVILRVVTREAVETEGKRGKWIVPDGGTGIYKQMGEWITRKGIDLKADKVPALAVKGGLIRSDYDGPAGPAKTYYLAQ